MALTKKEEAVILHKSTEFPFTGKYWNHFAEGNYVCKQCGTPLYSSKDKFKSMCGWPAFDDDLGNVKSVPEGRWDEIVCKKCGGHLGHVFTGERLTKKNVRHCVNSISLQFVPEKK